MRDQIIIGFDNSQVKNHGNPPSENLGIRLTTITAAKNPLLEAARPLLRALTDLPDFLESDAIAELHTLLEQELRLFQKLCEQANIRRDHMIGARYCLCTALDEAAMQTTWGRGGASGVEWITNGLASTFHEDRQGGDKVYLLIGRLMTEPREHIDLLEVIYRILSFGFEGRYRFEADGRRKHETVRQRLYTEITAQRGPVPIALSPHWHTIVQRRRISFHEFPIWITVATLSIILLSFFGYCKYVLETHGAEVHSAIGNIGRMTPPVAPPSMHLKELLKDEITSGTVTVDETAHRSSVIFRGDDMFPAGKIVINPAMTALVEKIAAAIAQVPGRVSITGYTDNAPIRSRQFASNQALSEERAAQVVQLLQSAGVPANRLEAIGKGEADPIGDNATLHGRAKNRRVEITVAR